MQKGGRECVCGIPVHLSKDRAVHAPVEDLGALPGKVAGTQLSLGQGCKKSNTGIQLQSE